PYLTEPFFHIGPPYFYAGPVGTRNPVFVTACCCRFPSGSRRCVIIRVNAMQREKKMAIKVPPAPDILTYEQYMAEEEICLRYDIIEGVRIYMPGPTWRHQRIADKITRNLLAY